MVRPPLLVLLMLPVAACARGDLDDDPQRADREGQSGRAVAAAVTFVCRQCGAAPGESVHVAGNDAALGGWRPAAAPVMTSTGDSGWTATVSLAAGAPIEYKFIKRNGDAVTWESGANRRYTVPASGSGTTGGTWGDTSSTLPEPGVPV